ncbi:MAG: hypothetical protein OHK0039_00250 [Bacteroidia bacterium]
MIIANPLYDVAFKYLMEDTEVARQLIGAVIGQDILHLELAAQEHVTIEDMRKAKIFRMDFAATIQTAHDTRRVLIEIQKDNRRSNIERFRQYLGQQYQSSHPTVLPIVAIYFLGFRLRRLSDSVISIRRQAQA